MERTFRGISVVGERILYRDADHGLLGARASVKTPAALRRDVSAGRLVLDEADLELMDHRGAAKGLFLVIVGEGFVMVVPVPIRKGSDARTFASRLNTAANRLALADDEPPVSEVSTMAERYSAGSSAGSKVSAPRFDGAESTMAVVSHKPMETTAMVASTPRPTSAPRAAAAATAAGWFTDPTGRFTYRYWDGQSWTEHVDRNGMRSRDPIVGRTSPAGTGVTLSDTIASMFGAQPRR